MQHPAAQDRRIRTPEDLREHLQWALEVEHAVLPAYLCALFSLDAGRNPDAVTVMAGAIAERLLHLALAANLLNAVGGTPRLDSPRMLPHPYPRPLPHCDPSLEVSLLPFGPEALDMFLRLDDPAPPWASAESGRFTAPAELHAAIGDGLRTLCADLGEPEVFGGDPARQVASAPFGPAAGHLIRVDGLASAQAALKELTGPRTRHGRRPGLRELRSGRRYRYGDTPRSGPTGSPLTVDLTAVRPMAADPRLADHAPGTRVRTAQDEFNHTYCAVLHLLEQSFTGVPRLFPTATATLYGLKAQAQALMNTPETPRTTAGPTFEYVYPESRRWGPADPRHLTVHPDAPYLSYGAPPLKRRLPLAPLPR
ncbi:ferritin-like protein [Actinocorallia herbida]|uniref:Ferritin-like protein n=1 Tax=Actinocorallia herbida TaxID=58109 RepID=A0A3N1CZC3_9ACTN|nr:ferritin-like domain-containing protein [Actinocorallia herbida]ROO86644.1 ferritin-like protein [Actinocorallia herbida]